jgi:hypothetical protein
MNTETRQYKDVAGNPVTLDWLVRNEPEWAANQIRHRDKLESELQQEKRDRAAACATLTKDCNLRGKYIRQLREAIIQMPHACTCTHTACVFGHDANCPSQIIADALKLEIDVAEPANDGAKTRP